jgi:hypothetical protein
MQATDDRDRLCQQVGIAPTDPDVHGQRHSTGDAG